MTFWQDNPIRLLFTWTRWRRLRHPTIHLVNVTLPLWAFAIFIAAGAFLPHLNLSHDLGLIQQMNGLLQILAPFFVAALTFVAAFPRSTLDEPMGGVRPYRFVAGEEYYPTRRELLGCLFSYLSALCILTYVGGALLITASNSAPQPMLLSRSGALHDYLGLASKSAYGALLIHLLATTLLGLHFLGNFMTSSTIHRDDPDSGGDKSRSPPPPPSTKHFLAQPPVGASASEVPEVHFREAAERARQQFERRDRALPDIACHRAGMIGASAAGSRILRSFCARCQSAFQFASLFFFGSLSSRAMTFSVHLTNAL